MWICLFERPHTLQIYRVGNIQACVKNLIWGKRLTLAYLEEIDVLKINGDFDIDELNWQLIGCIVEITNECKVEQSWLDNN